MFVRILGKSEIDYDTFLATTSKGLGRSLTRKLDSQGKDVKTLSSFLVMLAEMKLQNTEPMTALVKAGSNLQQAFYSFLVISESDTLFQLMEQTPLSVQSAVCTNGLRLAVVAGNLEVWRTAIINCCSDSIQYELRDVMDKILLLFETEGLGRIWENYSKKPLSDNTFKLIEKK